MSSFECCPADVILHVAEMLSPVDTTQLASINRMLRETLPVRPLRIRIVHGGREHHSLGQSFFVSEEGGTMLSYNENLHYGLKYRLWLYDMKRQHRVDLRRHIPLSDKKASAGFDIALLAQQRSRHDPPNVQLWEVCPVHDGIDNDRVVPFGTDVGLRVGGDRDNHIGHPGSKEQKFLSVETKAINNNTEEQSTFVQWHATPSTIGANEKMMLFRSDDKNIVTTDETRVTSVPIRARSVFYDSFGGITFYSQRSLEGGDIAIQRNHATVKFELWSESGYLHFRAENLPFTVAVPIVLNDKYEEIQNEHKTIEMLYNLKHKNFFPGKMYLAVAADCLEGNKMHGTLSAYGAEDWADGVCDEKNEKFIVRHDGKDPILSLAKEMINIQRNTNRTFLCVFVE